MNAEMTIAKPGSAAGLSGLPPRNTRQPVLSQDSFDSLISSNTTDAIPQGRAFGAYQLGELLGKGGCGQVFAATHRWLDKPVAIKFLSMPEDGGVDAIERFRREARTAAQLNHPAFVRATDGGIEQGHAFLVTDLIDGEDLSAIVRRRGPLPIEMACEIAAATAEALAYLEQRQVVHRDLKPSNIMVDREGRVYILDLGLARNVADATLTTTGAFMGTVDFLAPEQAVDPRGVTSRADMYSLGCTLYYLLTGRAPFECEDSSALAASIFKHVEEQHEPITAYRPDVPSAISKLIDQLLEKHPEDRPRTFGDIARKLREVTEGVDLRTVYGDALPQPKIGKPEYDWLDELIVKVGTALGRTLLLILGIIESDPGSRPGARRFRTSYRWLKAVAWIAGIYGFLLFAGIGFEVPWLGITIGAPPPPGFGY